MYDPLELRMGVLEEFAEVSWRYRQAQKAALVKRQPLLINRSYVTPYIAACERLTKARAVLKKQRDKRSHLQPKPGTQAYEQRAKWAAAKRESRARGRL